MQRLTIKGRADRNPAGAGAIHRVANQGMADVGQMHANLVGTARLQRTFDQGAVQKAFENAVMGARRFAGPDHRHFGSLRGMAAHRRIDRATLFESPPRQCLVVALHRARLQLAHEIGLRFQGFGDDHQAAGVLVQPMHNTGTRQAFQCRRVVQQRILQGAAPVAAARMNHQSRRFVDDDQAFVLIRDVQCDGFRLRGLQTLVRHFGDFNRLAAPEFVPWLGDRRAIDRNPRLANPVLQPTA